MGMFDEFGDNGRLPGMPQFRGPGGPILGMGGSPASRMPLMSVEQGRQARMSTPMMQAGPRPGGPPPGALQMDPAYYGRIRANQEMRQSGTRPGLPGADGRMPNAVQQARMGAPGGGLGGSLDPKYAALNAYLMQGR